MITCVHCRLDVPDTASKCPYCHENPWRYDDSGPGFFGRLIQGIVKITLAGLLFLIVLGAIL